VKRYILRINIYFEEEEEEEEENKKKIIQTLFG